MCIRDRVGTANGAVDLYWDGTKKFETYQYGVKSPGHIVASTDGYGFYAGAGFDIEMLHDGSDSRIKNITGDLEFQEHTSSGNIIFKTTTSGTERLRITSAGNVNQTIDADAIGFNQTAAGNHYIKNIVNANRTGANASILALHAHWNSKDVAAIKFRTGADTSNKDDGIICFETSSANNITERLRITSDGKIGVGVAAPVGTFEIRDSKANLIVAKDGLTAISNTDAHTTYDLIQLGAGGGLASYSTCLLYTSPSPRDRTRSRMPSSA